MIEKGGPKVARESYRQVTTKPDNASSSGPGQVIALDGEGLRRRLVSMLERPVCW